MKGTVRIAWLGALVYAIFIPAQAHAQGSVFDSTPRFEVNIVIESSGDLEITETIVQEFGSTPRHGIFRSIPDRFRYDDEFDRIYPIDLISVRASPPGTPDDVETEEENGNFVIRIGDPDTTVTGRHTYEIIYRVQGAMNGFADHDELFWNAIGDQWEQDIGRMNVRVSGTADIARIACFQGPFGSTVSCSHSEITRNGDAVFEQSNLPAFQAMSVVVALPAGTVASTAPILDERWSLDKAFARTPTSVGGGVGLLVLIVGGFGTLMWKRGRDVRFRGSQVDQVMGGPSEAETQAVPLFEKGTSVVEFAPPEGLRPGQVGTLVDEVANTLDVSATIVDLAVRKYLVIEEIPKTWLLGKPDWNLRLLPEPADDALLPYEKRLLDGLFEDGDQVELSALRTTFAERLRAVKDALYNDVVSRKWFLWRPDRVRHTWTVIGWLALSFGIAITIALAAFTKYGLLGIPLVTGGILLLIGANRMPARTAKGTAMTRRVDGFRVVIEKAEEHMSKWAEQENVFTRFLPYAVVFGVTDKWAKAFESLGQLPSDTTWFVSSRPFVYAQFAHSIDSFTVQTSGTISSTPAGSGSSGFGGGGFGGGGAGGGGGGGGGGSW
ncbi:MAG TPA: DUF2207 domain-containing protein [Actinomycetota bacterium]|nr:DUF2207 domain-containing protein [Actinomycetota bacterium]